MKDRILRALARIYFLVEYFDHSNYSTPPSSTIFFILMNISSFIFIITVLLLKLFNHHFTKTNISISTIIYIGVTMLIFFIFSTILEKILTKDNYKVYIKMKEKAGKDFTDKLDKQRASSIPILIFEMLGFTVLFMLPYILVLIGFFISVGVL